MSSESLRALATQWRFLDSGAADGPTNMATDAALMASARRSGLATVRVYAWDRPTLSLGRHERALGRFDPARLAAHGVDVVRRPTGGRALLHHREVTYSVTAPLPAMSLVESYAAINALLLDALARLGVHATTATASPRPLRPEGAACFAEPGAGELTVGGAKLVGSAQLREDGALLQHGSILLADDQSLIDLLRVTTASPERPAADAATLGTILGREVTYAEVRDALAAAFERASGTEHPGSDADPPVAEEIARLAAGFGERSWTWRR